MDYSNEIWKKMDDYGTWYEVSNMNRWKNTSTGKIHDTKQKKLSSSNLRINITYKNKPKIVTFSNIVAKAFVDNPDNKPLVWHLDRNHRNNIPENLIFATRKEVNQWADLPNTYKKHPVARINIITNKREYIFESAQEAAEWVREEGITENVQADKAIFGVCNGSNLSMYGYKWKYHTKHVKSEKWRKHPKLKNIWVSNQARIKLVTKKYSKLLFGYKDKRSSYTYIGISDKSYKRTNLVGQTFVPNPDNKPILNHLDENKENDRVKNLEWVTSEENTRYSANKIVYQYKLDKKTFKKEWESATIVEKELGINNHNISACCRGIIYQSVGGYFWSYTKL